jgi:hypothetical protein
VCTTKTHRTPNADDIVVGVLVEEEAIAYPWWMLRSYHNVNDLVAATPIYVSFCEACASAAAFTAIVGEFALIFEFQGDRGARSRGLRARRLGR